MANSSRAAFVAGGKRLRSLVAYLIPALLVGSGPAGPAVGEVRTPAIVGDHMVLQREKPIVVWGWAGPGEGVTVSLADQSATATADDKSGAWRVALPAQPAATGKTLTVRGDGNELVFADVAIGEVWVCSGQSNMEWPVNKSGNGDLILAAATRPDIRLITVAGPGSQTPQEDFHGEWRVGSPRSVAPFSAVGYGFGRRIADTVGIPVGLIDNAWGGSACEAWVPRDKLANAPFFQPMMKWVLATESKTNAQQEAEQYQEQLALWKRAVANAEARGALPPEMPRARGFSIGNRRAGNLYNARVHPILGYTIRGAIWYQGESNAARAAEYRDLFPMMIQSWRDAWGQGDFPFYWVQLADFLAEQTGPEESNWAELRESQTLTLDRLPSTGQAVIIDLGEASDIHPRNKQEVANRLARHALAKDYGLDIACESPRYASIEVADGKAVVTFSGVRRRLRTFDAKQVEGFVIRGADGKWRPANAKLLKGNRVEVSSPDVAVPVAVRYAWANNPVCNLYDATGLPVTPFRTEVRPTDPAATP
ncbi:MAG: sialate O-acetylesterase [Planctomycetota bacterium]